MKAFEQIEAKKMKALQNTFWGDFKKAYLFCKHLNKSAFLFSEENSNLFKPFVFGGPNNDRETFLHQNWKHFFNKTDNPIRIKVTLA